MSKVSVMNRFKTFIINLVLYHFDNRVRVRFWRTILNYMNIVLNGHIIYHNIITEVDFKMSHLIAQ